MQTEMNELQLIRLLKEHPSNGIEQLINTYSGLVSCIMRNVLNSLPVEHDMDEYVSGVFIEFYEKLDRIDLSKGSIKAYIATMAKRRAIDIYRRLTTRQTRIKDMIESEYDALADDAEQPDQLLLRSDERSRLLNAIHMLGQPDCEIILRRYFLEQSVTDIAKSIGMERSAVSKRISRALIRLKKQMEDDYE